jgi:hypothetical protein
LRCSPEAFLFDKSREVAVESISSLFLDYTGGFYGVMKLSCWIVDDPLLK